MHRKTSESWAHNIIEGSNELTTPNQWKHFYAWLASPNTYSESKTNNLVIDNTPPNIEPYDDCLVIDTVQNGIDTIINITNPSLFTKHNSDDEKNAVEDEKVEM